jgi:3-isopropylmalate/(R)-2-methylmalate dehydratase large subunit
LWTIKEEIQLKQALKWITRAQKIKDTVVFFRFKRKRHLGFIPRAYFATADHNTPTINQHLPVEDPLSANQLRALEENSKEYGISHWD